MNCSSENLTCEVFQSTNLTEHESSSIKALRLSLLSLSLLFGVPTHSYVIWLIITGAGSGVASEFFNLNLSVCGIIFSLYALISFLRTFSNLKEPVSLILVKFLMGNIFTVRPLFQCLICVERYLAVVHPVTFLKYKPLRYKVICSAAVWITGLGSCVFCMFIVETNDLIFIWFSLLQFLLFFSIQLFCLVAVLRALKQSGPGERRREKEEENHMKRRAFYLILTSIMTLLIIFVPFIFTGFFCILLQQNITLFILFSSYCFVLGSFLPAFHYLWRTGNLPFIKPP